MGPRTSTMRYSLLLLLVTSVVTFNVLKLLFMSWFPDLIVNLSLVLLTVVLADLLVKLAANVLPRKLLPDLENKAVFITGCDSGFGNLCARRLDALGTTVYAGCLMPEGAGAKELKDATSDRLHIVPLDVTKQDDVDKVVEHVKDTLGDQDLWAVINNAGIFTLGEVEFMPLEVFHRINEVNTIGSVRVTKAFLSLIRKSKGRFVFTASILGRITIPGVVPYSMSKHAIVSFIDGLRREMRKWSVTVHGIEPMAYRTPMANTKPYQNFLEHQWSDKSEEVQKLYGDSYVEKYMEKINAYVRTDAYQNLEEVVNDLVDAAVGATPRNHYVPGLIAQIQPKLAWLLEESLLDFFVDLKLMPSATNTTLVSRTLKKWL